jgi:hypothetical protein
VIDAAKRLSATHTLTGGHRGFDILHVATVRRQLYLRTDDN